MKAVLILYFLIVNLGHSRPPVDGFLGMSAHVKEGLEQYDLSYAVMWLNSGFITGLCYHGYGQLSEDPQIRETQLLMMNPSVRNAFDKHNKLHNSILTRYQVATREDAVHRIRASLEYFNKLLRKINLWFIHRFYPISSQFPVMNSPDNLVLVPEEIQNLYKDISQLYPFPDKHKVIMRYRTVVENYCNQLEDDLEEIRNDFTDAPQSYLAAYVQLFFVAHMGGVVIPNDRHWHPIGDLTKDPELTALNKLLGLLIHFNDSEISDDELKRNLYTVFNGFRDWSLTNANARKYIKNTKPSSKSEELKQYNREIDTIVDIIVKASLEQKQQNSLRQVNKNVYPQNMLVTVLLAYVWEKISDVGALSKLSSLIDQQDHTKRKQGYSPDEIVVFGSQILQKNSLIIPSVSYRGGVQAHRPLSGEDPQKSPSFFDCGETSIYNFIRTMIAPSVDPITEMPPIITQSSEVYRPLDLSVLYSMKDASRKSDRLLVLIRFFEKYKGDFNALNRPDVRNEWASIMANLNEGIDEKSTLRIDYLKDGWAEIQTTGVKNFLNIMARLTGDPKLNAEWDGSNMYSKENLEAAGKKIHRLCEIFSTETWKLTTVNNPAHIQNNYTSVTFVVNNIPAFDMLFDRHHVDFKNYQQLKEVPEFIQRFTDRKFVSAGHVLFALRRMMQQDTPSLPANDLFFFV